MRKFWHAIDHLGRLGTTWQEWERELGNVLPQAEALLRPSDAAGSIPDPDWPGKILDLEPADDGGFLGLSQEIPAHRPPLRLSRAACVRLVPNLKAIAGHLASALGFEACSGSPSRKGALHEVGTRNFPRQEPRPVFLHIPDGRPRELSLAAALPGIEGSILLLPTSAGYSGEVAALARRLGVDVSVLGIVEDLREITMGPGAGSDSAITNKPKAQRRPLFNPRSGRSWRQLTISIEGDGVRFRFPDEERIATWKELRIRPVTARTPNRILGLIDHLGAGGRITQGKRDGNNRRLLTDCRQFLQELIPIDESDSPFQKFSDGWGCVFHVNRASGRASVAEFEAHDAEEDEDEFPGGSSELDPEDYDRFSLHSL